MRVGVEVGGTFTDLVAIGPDGGVRIAKVPSTPGRPDEGAFDALRASGIPLEAIADLAHGSTVATNAVLERRGGPIAFVATAGFRDVLFLQRHHRTSIYDLAYRRPEPVVERRHCFEVPERTLADGSVLAPLDGAAVERGLIPALRGGRFAAVAVCLLNAYANPAHERRLREAIGAHLPDLLVTLSSDVGREFREYERASTTALAAYVQPVIDRYVGRFERRLRESGFRGRFSIMQSNGGRLPAEGMRRNAVTALLSGPAAGVMGATRQAERSGFRDLITLDMGGTSTDVCLVEGGRPQLTSEFEIGGLPVRTPVLDINTVGAGGGSLIWVDEGGMLRVGPRSAGADPGPACYGRGGAEPTVTDAHVVRNTIRPEAFLGGRMPIDPAASRAALGPLAAGMGMTVAGIADSAIRVANANVVRAIQLVTTERGKDPRDYAMVPFGGAGPLHAARVAEDLGVRTILVPPSAGVISAFGLLASDYIRYERLTRRLPLDARAPAAIGEVFAGMRDRALARFEALGLRRDPSLGLVAEMRFVGQAFEVPVEIDPATVGDLTADRLRALFAEAHQRIYFHGAGADKPIEVVSFRLGVAAPADGIPVLAESRGPAAAPAGAEIEVFEHGAMRRCALMSRAGLEAGAVAAGPALLEDPTSTVLVPAGWSARVDGQRNMILTRAG